MHLICLKVNSERKVYFACVWAFLMAKLKLNLPQNQHCKAKLAAFSLSAPDHEHQHKVIPNANEVLHAFKRNNFKQFVNFWSNELSSFLLLQNSQLKIIFPCCMNFHQIIVISSACMMPLNRENTKSEFSINIFPRFHRKGLLFFFLQKDYLGSYSVLYGEK